MSAAAIVAVIHDIIFTVGVYALFHFPVSPATVTAFLTILGFSLYDTVVVFDKVVEFQRTLTGTGRSTYREMVNRSLNAVLMRSVSTSLVALLPVISLLVVGAGILGATALEDFALALAAGLFIGSYSSIFVAAPLLAWWKEREPQYRALAERRRRSAGAAVAGAGAAPVSVAASAAVATTVERRRARKPTPRMRRRASRSGSPGRRRCPAARSRPVPASSAAASASSARRRPNRRDRRRGSVRWWQWIPRGCRRTCATSSTIRSRGSSSRTSPRCSPRPTPSAATVDALAEPYATTRVDKVIGIEARGFVFAAPVAYRAPGRVSCPCASRASCPGRSSARSTCSSTAPTSSRSTATRSRPASRC